MARTPLIAGNWKMNLNHFEAIALVQKIAFSLPEKYFEKVDVTVIPPSGVQRSSTGPYAFVVDDGSRAQRRRIVVGQATEDLVVIKDGVQPGERVVIDGSDRIREGQTVEAVTPAGAT